VPARPYGDGVTDEMAKPLPYRDIHAVFDVVVVFHSELLSGAAPPDMVRRMTNRMTRDGFLPPGASAGELAATIGDLVQRLHYAMGSDDVLPQASPREIWHSLQAATESAALACRDELIELGSPAVVVREIEPDVWEALASFPDLPPDPSFEARRTQLQGLAQRLASRYSGWQS